MLRRLRELWGARARIRSLEDQRDWLTTDRNACMKNSRTFHERAKKAESSLAGLGLKNAELKRSLDDAIAAYARVADERDGFRTKLGEALERVADLEDQVEDLEETADELRAEIAAFEELLDEAASKEAGNRDYLIIAIN